MSKEVHYGWNELVQSLADFIGLFIVGLIIFAWRISSIWDGTWMMAIMGIIYAGVVILGAALSLYGFWVSQRAKIQSSIGVPTTSRSYWYWMPFAILCLVSVYAWVTAALLHVGTTVTAEEVLWLWALQLGSEAVSVVNILLWTYLYSTSFSIEYKKQILLKVARQA